MPVTGDGRLQIQVSLKSKGPENTFIKKGKKLLSDVNGTPSAIVSALDSHSYYKG